MLGWALTFLVIALIAAALGFGGIAGTSAGIAQILFFVFIALFVIAMIARAVVDSHHFERSHPVTSKLTAEQCSAVFLMDAPYRTPQVYPCRDRRSGGMFSRVLGVKSKVKIRRRAVLGFGLATAFVASRGVAQAAVPVVAAASDLQFVLEEIAAAFRADTDRKSVV